MKSLNPRSIPPPSSPNRDLRCYGPISPCASGPRTRHVPWEIEPGAEPGSRPSGSRAREMTEHRERTLSARSLGGGLLDMDGTLVDSEKLWDAGLSWLAGEYGARLSAQARTRMVGTSMTESMTIMHDDIGQGWRDPQASVVLLEKRVKELFGTGLIW